MPQLVIRAICFAAAAVAVLGISISANAGIGPVQKRDSSFGLWVTDAINSVTELCNETGQHCFGAAFRKVAISKRPLNEIIRDTENHIGRDSYWVGPTKLLNSSINDARALVVSVEEYGNFARLEGISADTDKVATALTNASIEVTRLSDPSRSDFMSALTQFGATKPCTPCLIYFSGHAINIDGRNFLLPRDSTLSRAEDVEFEGVEVDSIARSVIQGDLILIVDGGLENPFARSIGGTR